MLTQLPISPNALLLDSETRFRLEQLHARVSHRAIVVGFILELNAALADLIQDIVTATHEAEQALERLQTFWAPAA
jgi:hypothetical protein